MGSREDPTEVVGTRLRRIFLERGLDFFDAEKGAHASSVRGEEGIEQEDVQSKASSSEQSHHMTPEELHKMRMSLLPQL